MWDLPRPGLEPLSPALTGRFLTTVPPGKPKITTLNWLPIPCAIFASILSEPYYQSQTWTNFLSLIRNGKKRKIYKNHQLFQGSFDYNSQVTVKYWSIFAVSMWEVNKTSSKANKQTKTQKTTPKYAFCNSTPSPVQGAPPRPHACLGLCTLCSLLPEWLAIEDLSEQHFHLSFRDVKVWWVICTLVS